MTVRELICSVMNLTENPKEPVVIVEGEDYEHKRRRLSVYRSADGEIVLEFWD